MLLNSRMAVKIIVLTEVWIGSGEEKPYQLPGGPAAQARQSGLAERGGSELCHPSATSRSCILPQSLSIVHLVSKLETKFIIFPVFVFTVIVNLHLRNLN